jgi:hypothetical protein
LPNIYLSFTYAYALSSIIAHLRTRKRVKQLDSPLAGAAAAGHE